MARPHVLKRLHRILILIEGAAADAHETCGLAHGVGLAHLQHTLGLRHFDKDLRQRLRRDEIVLFFLHVPSNVSA